MNFVDYTGRAPSWNYKDPLDQAIADFVEWYLNSDEEERDDEGNLTLNAKLKQTVQAVNHNIAFSAGLGLGFYGGIIATEYLSLDAGLHYDVLRVQYYNGNFDAFEYGYQGIEASFLFFSLGDSEERRRAISNPPNQWQVIESPEVLPVFGVSAYFFGGGSLAVGFDLNSFLYDINQIWR